MKEDKIKLAQRTIALLSSMIESGECHTARTKEMKTNALNGLDEVKEEPKEEEDTEFTHTLLCVVRLFVFLPLILICFCFVPIMYFLGISDPFNQWGRLIEGIVFDVED